jgi:hypothetical protein
LLFKKCDQFLASPFGVNVAALFAHDVAHTVEALKSRLVHILRTGTVG